MLSSYSRSQPSAQKQPYQWPQVTRQTDASTFFSQHSSLQKQAAKFNTINFYPGEFEGMQHQMLSVRKLPADTSGASSPNRDFFFRSTEVQPESRSGLRNEHTSPLRFGLNESSGRAKLRSANNNI